jgi:rieske iron-sulfur protein
MSKLNAVDKDPLTRRDFLKLLGAAGVGLAFAPFLEWGRYMPNPQTVSAQRERVMLQDGTQANVRNFPINHAEIIAYPPTGDPVLDKEAFRQWQLIRLPAEYGGDANDVSAFRVYSMVCVHLWCVWKYVPETPKGGNNKGQCPCHGSMYDPLNGKAIAGPASLQAPPTNVLPTLYLDADKNQNLWIKPAKWNANENGIIGYGRFLKV